MPDDEVSRKTFKLIELASGGLSPEQPPPWELLIRAAGIVDLETFAEVWHRMGIARRVYEEAARRRQPKNGQPAPQTQYG
jgi:hypothetical protein